MILKLLIITLFGLELTTALVSTRYYPRYHLAPVKGWMNDPNGFCVFDGYYHLFYQYNPVSSLVPGTARWGHAKSKDLFHWVDAGIALQNDSSYDKNGVFSGSAVVDSGVMYIYYTGHVKLPGQTPDQNETQQLVTSSDGVTFTKYEHNPVIVGETLQPNIRDPKVWKHNGNYYMVLGNSFHSSKGTQLGRVLLYKSTNRTTWTQVSVLDKSDGFLGYMWECPDFFEIDGVWVLLFSPQGVQADGDKYKNLYQTGYIVGNFNYTSHVFTPITPFRELDSGHDFYATQTILDSHGRRLLVAWMDMWETSYPEAADGFTGQMTLVRTLTLTEDYRLLQNPVKEYTSIRKTELFSGLSSEATTVQLSNKTGEVHISTSGASDFTLYIGNDTSAVEIHYEASTGRVSLKRDETDDGLRRTKYGIVETLTMRIFIDASSIEVFVGDGSVAFSTRFFVDSAIHVRPGTEIESMTVYDLKSTLYNS